MIHLIAQVQVLKIPNHPYMFPPTQKRNAIQIHSKFDDFVKPNVTLQVQTLTRPRAHPHCPGDPISASYCGAAKSHLLTD